MRDAKDITSCFDGSMKEFKGLVQAAYEALPEKKALVVHGEYHKERVNRPEDGYMPSYDEWSRYSVKDIFKGEDVFSRKFSESYLNTKIVMSALNNAFSDMGLKPEFDRSTNSIYLNN
ncbi:hypothetical protein GF336_07845 [Candidatus Woesearchaeota archaeon]|nr:hypothetical protein [Candidatus Woesearchaeota archaeon]